MNRALSKGIIRSSIFRKILNTSIFLRIHRAGPDPQIIGRVDIFADGIIRPSICCVTPKIRGFPIRKFLSTTYFLRVNRALSAGLTRSGFPDPQIFEQVVYFADVSHLIRRNCKDFDLWGNTQKTL